MADPNGAGGPPQGPGPGGSAAGGAGNQSRSVLIVGMLLAAVVLVLGLVFILDSGDGDEAFDFTEPGGTSSGTELPVTSDDSPTTTTATTTTLPPTTTTDPGFVQGEGEIFLEPVDAEGPDPFTGEEFDTPTTTTAPPPSTIATPAPTGPTAVTAEVGDTPALYGGTRDNAVCDKAGQLAFLQQNADKAAAWVEALNGDETLMWSGGTSLTVEQLPEYFAELTPVVLTRDTRVTNHGYRDGRPTSRQVVLQAGTAVLVDAYGVPRARCLCGNPLTAPAPVQVTPVYTGNSWPDFNPETIIVINQTTVVIEVLVLVDVNTGEEFVRPVGSDGTADTFSEASIWQIDFEATEAEVGYSNTTTVMWSGEFTIADDGTISGTGTGTWTFEGNCINQGDASYVSTDTSSGTFTVSLRGEATRTELGRFVKVNPAYGDFVIGAWSSTAPDPDCEQELYDSIESWVAPSFTVIESVQAENDVVLASIETNGYVGGATFTPIG